MRPRLYINHDPGLDTLTALELGRVADGVLEEQWRPIGERFAYLHDGPARRGRVVGFGVHEPSSFDPDSPEYAPIWSTPRFDAPQLGLTAATRCKRDIPGGGAGQLSFMLGVGTDAAGAVYVADSGNSRVGQFATGGAFVRAFGLDVVPGDRRGFEVCTGATGCKRGRSGSGAGAFRLPSAVAADPSGAIYVSDAGTGRIQCLGEPGASPCVRNLFDFGGLERDRRRGAASLTVQVPGPGKLAVRGK